MRNVAALVLALALIAGAAAAGAPETSPRPLPRPGAVAPETVAVADPAAAAVMAELSAAPLMPTLRPRARPALQTQPQTAPDGSIVTLSGSAVAPDTPMIRPPEKKRGFLAALIRPNPAKEAVQGRKGSVCGDPAIRGETISPIVGKLKGCGIAEPVRVTAVDGVALSTPATLDCTTARALKSWVQDGLKPAFGRKGVVEMQVAAHYACRSRNNVRGAPVSEHGRGKAIDISGLTLANGTTLTVAQDWRRGAGRPMKQAHKAACGIFGTTLGPGSDGYHEDHMHFDSTQRRTAYCR